MIDDAIDSFRFLYYAMTNSDQKKRLYELCEGLLASLKREDWVFRREMLGGGGDQAEVLKRKVNVIMVCLPMILETYLMLQAEGKAKVVGYTADDIVARIEKILREPHPKLRERELWDWVEEIRLDREEDVTKDMVTEGWED